MLYQQVNRQHLISLITIELVGKKDQELQKWLLGPCTVVGCWFWPNEMDVTDVKLTKVEYEIEKGTIEMLFLNGSACLGFFQSWLTCSYMF